MENTDVNRQVMEEQFSFANRQEFRNWLKVNHDSGKGIWIIFPTGKADASIKADEALEEALCFGWIDGQIKKISPDRYMKKFTPRRKGSKWSARNRKIADSLIKSGGMTESGTAAIEQAQVNGTWDTTERPVISDDQVMILTAELTGTEPAYTNFMNMSPSVRRTYTAHFLDAKKEETRRRRLQSIIERLNENKKPM